MAYYPGASSQSLAVNENNATLSRFELRLLDGVEEGLYTGYGQKSLLTGIWINGELLDEPHFVDLRELVQSFHADGERDFFTCACGVAACARIAGIHVTHRAGQVHWRFYRPQSVASLVDPDLSSWEMTARVVHVSFERQQMLDAMQVYLERVRALIQANPHRFNWPVHGFEVEDLLRIDPTKVVYS